MVSCHSTDISFLVTIISVSNMRKYIPWILFFTPKILGFFGLITLKLLPPIFTFSLSPTPPFAFQFLFLSLHFSLQHILCVSFNEEDLFPFIYFKSIAGLWGRDREAVISFMRVHQRCRRQNHPTSITIDILDQRFLGCGGCHMHCLLFTSIVIRAVVLLSVPLPGVSTRSVSKHSQISCGEVGGAKLPWLRTLV